MKLFNHKYLSQDQLKRLDTYKYAAIDTSPISQYVMHPFWNYVVEFVPLSIAPNILTLTGFGCTLFNAFILTYYDYHFFASSDEKISNESIPPIVWLICAVNLFLAHTLDGIDGKQARRTKSTGPLGELMDHGVDSWTAVFVPMYVYSLFGSSDHSLGPHKMLFVFWSVFLTFYITHWEKYNTGVLYLPWSYDLSQLFLFICSLITYWCSYKVWKASVPLFGYPYGQAFAVVLYISVFLTLPLPIHKVYMTYKSGKLRCSSFKEVVRPLAPFSLLFLVSVTWAYCSKTDVLSQDPRVYFFTVGTVFSNISCRLIVSQMSSTRCELINRFTIIFSLVALSSLLLPSMAAIELLSLRLLALVLTICHIHYAVSVVRQMCDHFKINCLSLSSQNSIGNHVIVSGGSKGIGKSVAKKFVELGSHVTLIARKEADLSEAKLELESYVKNKHVQKIRTVPLDLTKITFPDDEQELLNRILGEHKGCDILVNCCGSSIPKNFEDISQQEFQYMMDVNYFSAVNLTKIMLPVMKSRALSGRQSEGRIVFVSSMCGLMSFSGFSAYSASKFALVGLAEALHMEMLPYNIGITVSFPPDTDTPGFEEENKIKPKLTSEISKTGNIYSPDEVAQAIVDDVHAKKFYSTVGIENLAVLMAMNTFMPSTSIWRVLVESLLAGPLKLVGFFILKSWYKMAEKASKPSEIKKVKSTMTCSKYSEL